MSRDVVDNLNEFHNNVLLEEFYRLKQELSNQHYSSLNPEKIARFNELQQYVHALNKAKEKIKQKIIVLDESPDNSVLYTAITKFKKTNE